MFRKIASVTITLLILSSYWLPIWENFDPIFKPSKVHAIDCGFGTDIGGGVCRGFLTTTGSLLTWTSPSDWNNAENYIEVLGAGGSGGAVRGSSNNATGGGGGAYSRIDDFEVATPGTTTASYRVGSGGTPITLTGTASTAGNAGSDTWFNDSSFPGAGTDNTKVGAKGGGGGNAGSGAQSGGAGGVGTSSWGQTRRSGGNGGSAGAHTNAVTGGGGAAGNSNTGGNGGSSSGNSSASNGGQANGSGAGGGSGASGNGGQTGGNGVGGTEWQVSPTRGSGGGGGGARTGTNNQTAIGGDGGNYGGGGGAAAKAGTGNNSVSGAGADGLIVITYTPVPNTSPTVALNTADESSTSDTTPGLDFTGTDTENDDIQYNIQIDANNTFDSDTSTPLFSDNFDDNSIDSAKWDNWAGSQVVEQNQRLELTATTSNGYYGIDTQNTFNLTGTHVTTEVINTGNISLNGYESYGILAAVDGDNYVTINFQGNQIYAIKSVGGSSTDLANITYNGTTMRWIRISESAGTTYWQYSADGASWTTLASESNPIAVTSMFFQAMVGTWQTIPSTTTMILDNWSIGGAPGEPLIDATSGTDSGFANQDTPADTNPFTSGELIRYTVQEADELADGTYYWRVRGLDPSGTNTYGDWSGIRSFTISAGTIVSITITTDGTINYGTVPPGQSVSTIDLTDTQTIENSGNVAIDLDVKTSGATGWTLGSSAGTDTFVHEFSSNAGSNWTQFTTVDSYQSLITNLSVSATQNLDLRITVPNPSTTYNAKDLTITIQAVQN